MRSSNILLYPGQMNQPAYPSNYVRSVDPKRSIENILPPLDYKSRNISNLLSTANPLANQRQLNAAHVLPNLKSVMEGITSSSENASISASQKYVVPKSSESPKISSSTVNQPVAPHYALPAPSSIVNSNQYFNSRYGNHYYPQQPFNINSPIKFIIHRGVTIYQGDHVSIKGSDAQIYFAVLMDFWLTENGKRYCTLRWLLPRPKASFTSALQNRFDLGPVHERVEAMETILDVFYSPYRDQFTAENIRRKFLLSPSVVSGAEETVKQSNEIITIDPPAQLVKAIKSLSGDGEDCEEAEVEETIRSPSSSSASISRDSSILSTNLASSPSSQSFKSSSEDVQMNPIAVAESSEIAAKMLLSMN